MTELEVNSGETAGDHGEVAPGHSGSAPKVDSGAQPVVALEIESKFRVHGLFRVPDLTAACPGLRVVNGGIRQLQAVYLDTADLRLARDKITLRRRTGGPDEGWHVKLPVAGAALGTRHEIRLPLESPPEQHGEPEQHGLTVPPQLSHLVVAYTRFEPLVPVAALHTERSVQLVLDGADRVLAEVTDDRVNVLDVDSGRVVAMFREVELERGSDRGLDPEETDQALLLVSDALLAAGAVAGGFASKVARALGPLAAQPGDVAESEPASPESTAGAALTAHLRRHVKALRTQDLRVRLDAPDSIHQMRVAARRLRSGLKVFRSLVDPEWADQLRDELGWIAAVLGEVRDREVLLARLEAELDELPKLGVDPEPARAAVRADLVTGLATARVQVLAELDTDRYRAMIDALVDGANRPRTNESAEQPANSALTPLVRKAWRTLARDVALLEMDGHDDEWHEARIVAKRLRYAVDACVPVFGDSARDLAEAGSQVTELLGEHQDAAIAAETVQRIALALGERAVAERAVAGFAAAGFALGVLHQRQRTAVVRARTEFLALWPGVSKPHRRRWLKD